MEMQRLTERGVNIHIYPIIQKRGRVFEGDYVKKDVKNKTIFRATEDSRWNLRCYKFMDYLSTRIRNNFEKMMYNLNPGMGVLKSISDQRLESFILLMRPDLIYDIVTGINEPSGQYGNLSKPYFHSPRISIKELAKELKWMKSDVISTIKMISNYKFKTEYYFLTAKLYGNTLQKNYSHCYTNIGDDFEPMFNVDFSDDNSECKLNFNTGFGICFLHNLYVGGYQLYGDELYSLSESPQILYRKRFLSWNCLPKVYLDISHVFDILGIDTKNKTNEKKLFEKIISELVEKSDIKLVEKLCDMRFLVSKGVKKKSEDEKKDNIIPINKKLRWDDLTDWEKINYITKNCDGNIF